MVEFAKLHLTGFKSFVDKTELAIEPGMTGIVGPNGCGKSNLVEALRWVMGETSAKRMRGSEMDDVIFGGSEDRPARNIAEVTLELDNRDRTAPTPFEAEERLDIARRIERGKGSEYRVNGKSVRARDVQLLFQDNSAGANSPALVSQGRVGALINAKPTERRLLLEEAAGIMGLHSRRHEAELRLRAAEDNLTRLEDVITAMEGQLANLKKQARQAARYRGLSERIRQAEAGVLHLRWRAAEAALGEAKTRLTEHNRRVEAASADTARASKVQAEAVSRLPDLRKADAEAAATVQRLVIERDGLAAEEQRLRQAHDEAVARLDQIARDAERERGLAEDAGGALGRLAEERESLTEAQSGEQAEEAEASRDLERLGGELAALETALAQATQSLAALEAEGQNLDRQAAQARDRLSALAPKLDNARRERDALGAEIAGAPDMAAAEAKVIKAQEALAKAQAVAEAAEAAAGAAGTLADERRESVQEARAARSTLAAEADGLRAVLDTGDQDLFAPLIDQVRVAKGFETAFGAALGDAATAPLDEAAPVHWRALPAYDAPPPLPDGAAPLAKHVKAPAALARRLSQIGLVDDPAAGLGLAKDLLPGQILVSRGGGQWHWDGYTAAEDAPTAAAVRLQQKNRLAELEGEIAAADEAVRQAETVLSAAASEAEAAQADMRQARGAVQIAFGAVGEARDAAAREMQVATQRQSRMEALGETVDRLQGEHADLTQQIEALGAQRAALPDPGDMRQAVAERRAALAEARAAQSQSQSRLDQIRRDAESRRRRLAQIADEERTWRARADGATGRLTELDARARQMAGERDRLADAPKALADKRAKLAGTIEAAEAERRAAGDRLAEGETALRTADDALKVAERAAGEAREARVRAEAAAEAAQTALDALAERIAERLQVRPQGALRLAGVEDEADLPEAGVLEARLERVLRERDNMGPVNLRAEAEAAELDQQIQGMINERQDLVAAIGRLRQGISQLNREARERLLGSFETVNGHFKALFQRLFGGGDAHLALTESDDPLTAGLEIMASPPGKKLQHLSLLSGGEQALTAIAVLFAVFLTNPAPICVLDEVDAPLDDANVDRFCTLVDEIARDGTTRFLIITHHRMTMARVDRLYGVTMPERGVSQLVSVDLLGAARMRQTA